MESLLYTAKDAVEPWIAPVASKTSQWFDETIDYAVQYEPIVERTLIMYRTDALSLMVQDCVYQPLNAMKSLLSDSAGLDDLTARYVLVMFLTYPLSLIFRMIPGRVAKNIYALGTGFLLAQYVLGVGWIHGALSAGVAYILMYIASYVPPFQKFGHVIVFLWMMLYMSFSHIYRMKVDYMGWSPDFTGPQMLITVKITQFAYNLIDGTVNKSYYERVLNDPDPDPKREGAKNQAKSRLKLSLTELPDPLEFYAWIYHYGLYFAGPAFELRQYQETVTCDAFVLKTSSTSQGISTFWPSVKAAMWKFLQAVVFLGLFQLSAAYVPFANEVLESRLTQRGTLNTLDRCLWLWLAFVGYQCKYYFAWKLSEGGANLAGFGLNASEEHLKSGQLSVSDWDGISQVDVLGFQTATNMQSMTRAWNQRVQWWLEHYVYRRAPRSYGINIFLTYFVSAFWHGFYPGYFLFFLSVPIFTELDKKLRTVFNPLFYVDDQGYPTSNGEKGKAKEGLELIEKVYHVMCVVVTTATTLYLVAAFVALDAKLALDVWRSFYFAPHYAAIVLHIVISMFSLLGILPLTGPSRAQTKTKKE